MLERDGTEVARATSIVRYAPGSSFPAHVHERGEEFLVLQGTFSDEHGDYTQGTYVRNPPGSSHRPFSREGCIIFVKLRQFDLRDQRRCVMRPSPVGVGIQPLHAFGPLRVSLVRLEAGASIDVREDMELLVVDGSVDHGAVHCERWTWVRTSESRDSLRSTTGCRFWLREGPLG
jgi:hypothetical protein